MLGPDFAAPEGGGTLAAHSISDMLRLQIDAALEGDAKQVMGRMKGSHRTTCCSNDLRQAVSGACMRLPNFSLRKGFHIYAGIWVVRFGLNLCRR
jgi:hypothetical protein